MVNRVHVVFKLFFFHARLFFSQLKSRFVFSVFFFSFPFSFVQCIVDNQFHEGGNILCSFCRVVIVSCSGRPVQTRRVMCRFATRVS